MNPLSKPVVSQHSVGMGPTSSYPGNGVKASNSKNIHIIRTNSNISSPSKVDVAFEKHLGDQRLKQLESDPSLFLGLTAAQKDQLEYYRYRITTFDRERSDQVQKVSTLESTRESYYQQQWDQTKKDEKIIDLEKCVSDAHALLFEERDQMLKLASENDELRVQEVEDRKRIQHLLALTQPVSQEVTYFKDCRPGKTTRQYAPIDKKQKNISRPSTTTGTSSTGKKGNGVVRTIYMPNENVDVLRLIIQSLRTQLAEQKAFNDQRCQALVEDRVIREKEHEGHISKLKKHIENISKDLADLMQTHKHVTKDYLDLRHEHVTMEREQREKLARLSQEQNEERKKVDKMKKEWADKEALLRNEGEVFVDMFRKQALGSEEDLAIVKGQYDATQKQYEKRIKALEAKLYNTQVKLNQADERRKLDMQGYQADIKTCKERLKAIEKALTGMKMIDGDGVAAIPPKVVKLLAHNKDFNDLKTLLADIAHRLDKGVV